MSKRLLICIFICLNWIDVLYGQWNQNDSIWLQNVLSGRDSLKLNPETMRAIQNGSFLNHEGPVSPMISSPSKLPILKDFSEYIGNNEKAKVALKDLPPAVFWLYGRDLPVKYKVNPNFYKIYPGSLKGRMRGTEPGDGIGVSFGVSFDHLLQMAFSPHYRQLEHNKKHAVAYKTYKENIPRKRNGGEYRTANPELILPSVKAVVKKDSVQVKPDSVQLFSLPDSIFSIIPGDSLLHRVQQK